MLRFAPTLTFLILLGPIGAGLLWTLLPAFGYLPVLGTREFSLDPWRELFAYAGFRSALWLTISTGFGASLVSLILAITLCATSVGTRAFEILRAALPPLLATPHVAIAIGFAFLVAPSGLIVRGFSPWATGWERPPGIATVNDVYGLSLIAGLALKETVYLILMIVAASTQVALRPMLQAASALGYGPARGFVAVIMPQIYRQIRLPIYAVLAFSLANVEMALILGPGNPPPLSVVATRWFAGYDLGMYYPASAAATLQFAIVVAGIGLWRLMEIPVGAIHRAWLARGVRRGAGEPLWGSAALIGWTGGLLALATLVAIAAWSFAHRWRYPDFLPQSWSLRVWEQHAGNVTALAGVTAVIAAAATLVAMVLALACLENEQRRGLTVGQGALWALYLPLLVPQIGFLFGAQMLLVHFSLDATLFAVIWAHLIFVMPYVFLSLADPFRALDPRYARSAAALGASPMRIFFTVKLPMLARPLAIACAIGFAVSIALYLPTLFAGAGRIATLTTEAVTLSSGGDRRVIGVYAFIQALLPLAVYAIALALPALIYRNRKGLA
ncbi:ABC transporter permease [Saliniramus sp.]|uniref:ABC transporter permease n=1 Tax=Saliniramus sp. TaxID=2986772 RepID=UPI002CA0F064|nr:ABC transporter permease [Saliniramus sp.]HMB10552.1 ABC transporter permease [Saliniramus sp.]